LGLSFDLLWRWVFGIPITGLIYFGSRHLFPRILEPAFKHLRIDCHYLPYGKFREYIVDGLKSPTEVNANPTRKKVWVRYTSKFLQYALISGWLSYSLDLWAFLNI